jgi:uncharacterized protein (TIGR02466 family)
MNIIPIFTNFIAIDFLDLDNKAIEDFCYWKLKNDPGVLENQVQVTFEEGSGPVMGPLVTNVMSRIRKLHLEFDFEPTVEQAITNVWINLNANSVTSAPHAHQVAMFSAVYWPKASAGSGNLEFMTPIAANRYSIPDGIRTRMNGFNSDMWSVKPEVGKLVIFPSWLYHFVRGNTDSEDRISIAINTRFDI